MPTITTKDRESQARPWVFAQTLSEENNMIDSILDRKTKEASCNKCHKVHHGKCPHRLSDIDLLITMHSDIVEQRWRKKFKPSDGCWVWQGAIGTKGYGLFTIGACNYRAHRVMWILKHGAIPKKLLILHRC